MSTQLISAVVIAKNEAHIIGACIEALVAVADEVLVYDSYSDDETVAICDSLGARVIQGDWLGYAATKNQANRLAKHDWILSIDADEVLSTALRQSIRSLELSNIGQVYKLQRKSNYCGQWVKYGNWNPDWKVRLFHRDVAFWAGGYVHETIQYNRPVQALVLSGVCLHYTVQTPVQYRVQLDKFARLRAEEMFTKGERPGLLTPYLKTTWEFLKGYVFKLGILDGWAGWRIAVDNARGKWLRYKHLQAMYRRAGR